MNATTNEVPTHKPVVGSLGILSNVSAMVVLAGKIGVLMAWWKSIPPELIQETIAFLTVDTVLFVKIFMALVGRWRAELPIKGIFSSN